MKQAPCRRFWALPHRAQVRHAKFGPRRAKSRRHGLVRQLLRRTGCNAHRFALLRSRSSVASRKRVAGSIGRGGIASIGQPLFTAEGKNNEQRTRRTNRLQWGRDCSPRKVRVRYALCVTVNGFNGAAVVHRGRSVTPAPNGSESGELR